MYNTYLIQNVMINYDLHSNFLALHNCIQHVLQEIRNDSHIV